MGLNISFAFAMKSFENSKNTQTRHDFRINININIKKNSGIR